MTRLALLVLAVGLVAPAALADHVFSHRIVVTGRVVDADGFPAPGLQPEVRILGPQAGGACFDSRDERTRPHGDFKVCRHAHAIGEGARVNVSVGGASAEAPLDKDLRRVAVLLQLPGPRVQRDIEADRTFPLTFRVEGRALRYVAEPENVEGVLVDAVPIGVNVTVSLGTANATIAAAEVAHDEHGDYAVDLGVREVPPDAWATASAGAASWQVRASALFRRADVDLVQALPEPDVPVNEIGNVPLGAGAALAALAAGAAAWRRRRA